MDQAIAPRQIEQPVAHMTEHRDPAIWSAARVGQHPLDIETERLIAIVLESASSGGNIGGALVPVERGHLADQRCDHRMELRIELKQIGPRARKALRVRLVVEVESAGEAGKDQAGQEDVGLLVMMAGLLFPAAIADEVGKLDRLVVIAAAGAQIVDLRSAVRIRGHPILADNPQGRRGVRLDRADARARELRLVPLGADEAEMAVAGIDDSVVAQVGDQPARMQRGNFAHQRCQSMNEVFVRQRAGQRLEPLA